MAGDTANPWTAPPIRLQFRLVDLDALKRHLSAIGRVADYAAQVSDPRELLAAARMIHEDAPRGLWRLGVRL